MKRISLCAVILGILFVFQSCRKYEVDEPTDAVPKVNIWYSFTGVEKLAGFVKTQDLPIEIQAKIGTYNASLKTKGEDDIKGAILAGDNITVPINKHMWFWTDPSNPADWRINNILLKNSTDPYPEQFDYTFTSTATYIMDVTSPTGLFSPAQITINANTTGLPDYDIRLVSSTFNFALDSFQCVWRFPHDNGIVDSIFSISEDYANGFVPKFANVAFYGTDSIDFTQTYAKQYVGCAPSKFTVGWVVDGQDIWVQLSPTSQWYHSADSLAWAIKENGSIMTAFTTYTGVPEAGGDPLSMALPIFRGTVQIIGLNTTFNPAFFCLPATTSVVLTTQYKTVAGGIYSNMVIPYQWGNTYYWQSGGVTLAGTGSIWFRLLENGSPSQFMAMADPSIWDATEGSCRILYKKKNMADKSSAAYTFYTSSGKVIFETDATGRPTK